MPLNLTKTTRTYYVVCQDDGPVWDGRIHYVLHIERAADAPAEAAEQFAALSDHCRDEQGPLHVTAYQAESPGAAARQARKRREMRERQSSEAPASHTRYDHA